MLQTENKVSIQQTQSSLRQIWHNDHYVYNYNVFDIPEGLV